MGFRENAANLTGKFLRKCVENNGMFLFATAAAGWALASAAQTVGLIANKEITKEEKRFLVPQEIMDGTFNIVSYAAITLPVMYGVEKLAGRHYGDNKQIIEGAKTLAAIAGSVVSSNIVTPLLRNKSSVYIKQKMEENKLNVPAPEIYDFKTQPYFAKQPRLTMDNYMNLTKTMSNSSSLRI